MSAVSSTRTKIRVVFEAKSEDPDAEPVLSERTLWSDQRDSSALERHRGMKIQDLPQIESIRWMAHHAGRRSMLHDWPATFEEFEKVCVEVVPVDEETVNPTEPAPEAG